MKICANSWQISTTNLTNLTNGDWYDLNGRKLDKMPTKKGVYIMNGRKVVVKWESFKQRIKTNETNWTNYLFKLQITQMTQIIYLGFCRKATDYTDGYALIVSTTTDDADYAD